MTPSIPMSRIVADAAQLILDSERHQQTLDLDKVHDNADEQAADR